MITYAEFIHACNERLIDKSIALENEKVEQALIDGDTNKVLRLLDEEF